MQTLNIPRHTENTIVPSRAGLGKDPLIAMKKDIAALIEEVNLMRRFIDRTRAQKCVVCGEVFPSDAPWFLGACWHCFHETENLGDYIDADKIDDAYIYRLAKPCVDSLSNLWAGYCCGPRKMERETPYEVTFWNCLSCLVGEDRLMRVMKQKVSPDRCYWMQGVGLVPYALGPAIREKGLDANSHAHLWRQLMDGWFADCIHQHQSTPSSRA